MRFNAHYFDGVRATSMEVAVTLTDSALSFDLNDLNDLSDLNDRNDRNDRNATHLIFSAAEFQIQPLLGTSRRIIELANGGRLEADPMLSLPAGYAQTSRLWQSIYALENKLVYIAGALVFTIVFFWALSFYGVPMLARQVALAMPLETESALGRHVLETLDFKHQIFQPSALPAARKAKIQSDLTQLCRLQQSCPGHTLEFRQSAWLGANAVALPGGIIVITDGLVALAQNDAEITAVLSHELGHVALRHALRQVLQSTVSGLLLVAVIGDIESIASAVPAALMQGRYSREMENEADAFAVKALQAGGISPAILANILERLDAGASASRPEGQIASDVTTLFSTHPDTASRTRRLRETQNPTRP